MSKLCRTLLLTSIVGLSLGVSAQTFTTIVNFNEENGAFPQYVSLVQGTDGLLYGTTALTVFKTNADGLLTTLHTFSGPDGDTPRAGLVLGTDGNFYGTTSGGGDNNWGTIFKVTSDGTLTTIYNFDLTHGAAPFSSIIQAADGNFYGTTIEGGTSTNCRFGCGTIFKLTPSGGLSTLHSFSGSPEGAYPYGSLMQGSDGKLYGTTVEGGVHNKGTIFRISFQGKFVTLHTFAGKDGESPQSQLLQAADGNLYGTTLAGGASNSGTVFKLAPGIGLTTIFNFDVNDGDLPYGGLIQATDGNLYGTTSGGGASNCRCGTAFSITTDGSLSTLHSFAFSDGDGPEGGLLQATNGQLFGTAIMGGLQTCDNGYGCGTIFDVGLGLQPFVAFVQPVCRIGQISQILGGGLTDTTNVSFNGIAAKFIVKSDTFIEAIVPAGATTGYVTVTTPTGTLTSNKPFVVIP